MREGWVSATVRLTIAVALVVVVVVFAELSDSPEVAPLAQDAVDTAVGTTAAPPPLQLGRRHTLHELAAHRQQAGLRVRLQRARQHFLLRATE